MSIEKRLSEACLQANRAARLLGDQLVKRKFWRAHTEQAIQHLVNAQRELQALIVEHPPRR